MDDDFDIYGDLDGLEGEVKKENKVIKELRDEIDELNVKIAEKESEKQSIARKNEILLENISSLLLTAKAELKRKDSLIADIRRQMDNTAFRRDRKNVIKHDQGTQTTMIRMLSQNVQTDDVGTMTEPRKMTEAREKRKERSPLKKARRERGTSLERTRTARLVDLRDRIRDRLSKVKTTADSSSENRKAGTQRWESNLERGRDCVRERTRDRERAREREQRTRHRETAWIPEVSPVRFSHPLRVSRQGHGETDAKLSKIPIPMNQKELDQFVKEIARKENRSPDECCTVSDRKKKETLDTSNAELWDAGLSQKKKALGTVRAEENIIQSDEIGTTLSPGSVEEVEQKMRALHGEPTPPTPKFSEFLQSSRELLEGLDKSFVKTIPPQPPALVIPPLEPPIIEQVPQIPNDDDLRLNDSRELRIVESDEILAEQTVEQKSAEIVIAKWQAADAADELEDGEIASSDDHSVHGDNDRNSSPRVGSPYSEGNRKKESRKKSRGEMRSLIDTIERKRIRSDRKRERSKKDVDSRPKKNRDAKFDASTPTRTRRRDLERERERRSIIEKPKATTKSSEPVKRDNLSAEGHHSRSDRERGKHIMDEKPKAGTRLLEPLKRTIIPAEERRSKSDRESKKQTMVEKPKATLRSSKPDQQNSSSGEDAYSKLHRESTKDTMVDKPKATTRLSEPAMQNGSSAEEHHSKSNGRSNTHTSVEKPKVTARLSEPGKQNSSAEVAVEPKRKSDRESKKQTMVEKTKATIMSSEPVKQNSSSAEEAHSKSDMESKKHTMVEKTKATTRLSEPVRQNSSSAEEHHSNSEGESKMHTTVDKPNATNRSSEAVQQNGSAEVAVEPHSKSDRISKMHTKVEKPNATIRTLEPLKQNSSLAEEAHSKSDEESKMHTTVDKPHATNRSSEAVQQNGSAEVAVEPHSKSDREIKKHTKVEKPKATTRRSEPVRQNSSSAEEHHSKSRKETLMNLFGSDDEITLCETPSTGKRRQKVSGEEFKNRKKRRVLSKEKDNNAGRVTIQCSQSDEIIMVDCEAVPIQPEPEITPETEVLDNVALLTTDQIPKEAPMNTPNQKLSTTLNACLVEENTATSLDRDQPLLEAASEKAPETCSNPSYDETFSKAGQLPVEATVGDTSFTHAILPEHPAVEISLQTNSVDTFHQDALNLDNPEVETTPQEQPTEEVTYHNDQELMGASKKTIVPSNAPLPSVELPLQEYPVAITHQDVRTEEIPIDVASEEVITESPPTDVSVDAPQNNIPPTVASPVETPEKATQLTHHKTPEVIIFSTKYSEYRVEDNNENETTFYVTRKKKKKKSKSGRANLSKG